MTNCVLVRLINGDEIIGMYNSETRKSYFIEDCYIIQYVLDPVNIRNRAVLVPYLNQLEKSPKGIEFNKTHVLHCARVNAEFEMFYNKTIQFIQEELQDQESYSSGTSYYKNSSKSIH